MNRNLCIILIFFFFNSCSVNDEDLSSNIYEGNITLSSQEEVDNFVNQNFQSVIGNLSIGSTSQISNITNLFGLNSLQEISGNLIIINNPDLESFNGLQNIINIGGSLVIRLNNSLENITEFSNIEFIGGGFYLLYNNSVQNIESFVNISELQDIQVIGNPNIVDLNFFNSLERIKSNGSIVIKENSNLFSLHGLENLETLQGSIIIRENPNLISIEGLQSLNLLGSLTVMDNNSLVTFDGLQNLNTLNKIEISRNESLISLTGLNNVEYIRDINISFNESLTTISALSALTSIGNDFNSSGIEIYHNNNLSSMDGFENVISFMGDIRLIDNEGLSDLCALQNILINGEFGTVNILSNLHNPSTDDIINGNNCSL